MTAKFTSNLFDTNDEYAGKNFWICFQGTDDEYFKFKTMCAEEKVEFDMDATKAARTEAGDDRLLFRKHVPRSRLLFILYYLRLWRPEDAGTAVVVSK